MRTSDPEALDAALLSLVLQRHPAAVHVEELEHAFAGDDWPSSVSSLVADGALHRQQDLHVASRCAVRVSELLG